MTNPSSVALTRGVKVRVESSYVAERSMPQKNYYFFAYHIVISNQGEVPVKLLSRHWIITDGEGAQQEIRGPGVIGEQPHLQPGESFEYTSYCPLPTPVGTMEGTYQMVTDGGDTFDARIAPFSLALPQSLN